MWKNARTWRQELTYFFSVLGFFCFVLILEVLNDSIEILFWKPISPVSNFRAPPICFFKNHKKISLIIWCFLQQFPLAVHGTRTVFPCCSVAFFILLYLPHIRRSHLIRCYSFVSKELTLWWLKHYLFLLNKRSFYVSVKILLLFDSLDPSNTSLCCLAWQGLIIC